MYISRSDCRRAFRVDPDVAAVVREVSAERLRAYVDVLSFPRNYFAERAANLRARGYRLFDIQMRTDHTTRLGAVEIPRAEYLARLRAALACDVTFG